MSPTPAQLVLVLEFALMAVGLGLLGRLLWRRAARPAPALALWPIALPDFFLFLLCAFGGAVVTTIVSTEILSRCPLSQANRLILAGAFFQLGMLGGCLGFALRHRTGGHDYSRPRRGFFGPGLVTFCISVPLLAGLGLGWLALLDWLHIAYDRQSLVTLFAHAESPHQLALLLTLAVVLAPLTEELVFRAGLFRYFHRRLPRWLALLVPALLFGASHMNLASLPQLVLLGVIFSLAYERTGNIAVPMFAHALFNLHTVAIVLSGVDL